MHRELRGADVDRRDAGPGRGHRADRRATRQVGAVLVTLQRHPGLPAGQRERRAGATVGGIAEIRMHFEYRAAVDRDEMARLVALGVVGVGGVRHVRRGHHGSRQPAQKVGAPATTGQLDAFERDQQQVGVRAAIRGRSHLFMVEQREHRQVLG